MTSKKKLYYALLFMSSFSFGQSSSDQLKELINSALEREMDSTSSKIWNCNMWILTKKD